MGAFGQSVQDRAVVGALQHVDPSLRQFRVLRRVVITEQLDAVVLFGGASLNTVGGAIGWGPKDKLGFFLQDRRDAGRVYLLDTEAGDPNCLARVERLAETDAVVSCTGEGVEQRGSFKLVFDPRAKAMVAHYWYAQFSAYRIFPDRNSAVFIVSDREKLLAVEYRTDREPAFRVLGDAEGKSWIARVPVSVGTEGMDAHRVVSIDPEKAVEPPAVLDALPLTTYDHFAALRPRRVTDGYKREDTEFHDSVGLWRKEDGRIWFAKSFYDGEGSSGVGGFGFFDLGEGKLHLLEPPEIVDWSVSAMAVTPEAVWLGIIWNGEGFSTGGGLLRYDRAAETVRRLQFPDLSRQIVSAGKEILIASGFGIGIVRGDRVSRYFIDRMSDGRYRVVEATAGE